MWGDPVLHAADQRGVQGPESARRGTVEFFAIHKYDKTAKDRVANGVRQEGEPVY